MKSLEVPQRNAQKRKVPLIPGGKLQVPSCLCFTLKSFMFVSVITGLLQTVGFFFLLSLRTAEKSFFSRCVHAPVGRIWHHVTEQPFPDFMFPLGFSYSCSIHLDYSSVLILSFKIAAEMA